MNLDDIIASFAALTGDAVGIGFCGTRDSGPSLVWVNSAYEQMFGYPETEILGQHMSFHTDAHDRKALADLVASQFRQGKTKASMEIRCAAKDGRLVEASVSLFLVQVEDGFFSTAIYRDLTELKDRERAAETALAERDAAMTSIENARTRLLEALNALPQPFSIWNSDLILSGFNRAFSDLLFGEGNLPPENTGLRDIVWRTIQKSVFPPSVTEAQKLEFLEAAMRDLAAGPTEIRNKLADGRTVITGSHWAQNGDIMVLSTDVTELEQQRRTLEKYSKDLEEAVAVSKHQALHDDLTGLGNRRFLKDALKELQERRALSGGEICALHVDLDRFKHINDTQGHAVGDCVLVAAANLLKEVTKPDDILARIGGDEFVVLRLLNDGAGDPEVLADQIVHHLCAPMRIMDREVRIGASVGLATTEISKDSDLLVDSDVALYKAKSLGRNRMVRFEQADLAELERLKVLSDDLIRALDAKEFVPFYQPQVDARSGTIVGFEALARWRHPTEGIRTPDMFLDLAEEMNVVEFIDQMIFERGVEEIPQIFDGQECPGLSFNVSHRRLMSKALISDAAYARNYPGQVAFELLESVFLDDENISVRLQLDALKDCGVEIELDDFGSGHASIIALEQVAPTRLKIDRRLIAPVTASRRSELMVRSIIQIGNALDIEVTAEGVETPEQARLLGHMGCERLQGFLFGRPTPIEDLPETIKALYQMRETVFPSDRQLWRL